MIDNQLLLLVDGDALVSRAYYSVPQTILTSLGEPGNAIYGFTNMLFKVLVDLHPTNTIIAFDTNTNTFRKKLYPAYKANRSAIPPQIQKQLPSIWEIIAALNFAIITTPDYEADDILGTLAKQASDQQIKTIILTGDRDLLQCVNEYVQVYIFKRGVTELSQYDEAAVLAKFNLLPAQIPDLKGLIGDSADNIPGVKGIGQKTAEQLLIKYKTLEELMNHLGELKPRIRLLLESQQSISLLSKNLATIQNDVAISLQNSNHKQINKQLLITILTNFGFNKLLSRIDSLG